jgi:hypothetical protein
VLVASFIIFCFVCIAVGIGLNYFLFQSSVVMETIVQVGRGTVTVTGTPVRREFSPLTNGDVLSTDPQTQATIFFRDEQDADRLIASVTLRGNTDLTMRRAVRPRYDWSNGSYNIELQELSGDLDIFIAKDLERPIRLTINSQQGLLIDIGTSGQYSITASDVQIKVVNRQGQVVLTPPNANIGHDIPVDNQALWDVRSPSDILVSPAYMNLLANSTFEDVFTPSEGGTSSTLAQFWRCANPAADPPGTYQSEIQDGRFVLRLVRSNGADSNGETRCGAFFPNNGYDITGLNSLVLRASFNIQYQSLAACGIAGSECPLMLQVDYVDAEGNPHRWYHGFYYAPQPDYPSRCDSCFEEHERVNEKTWYTYDSGNWLSIFTFFPPEQRPVSIVNVQFYASGHQYDVYVGEVALLAGP